MATTQSTTFSETARNDLQAVINHITSGSPLNDELRNRITERSKKAQEELVRQHGIREIAVELIREGRDARP